MYNEFSLRFLIIFSECTVQVSRATAVGRLSFQGKPSAPATEEGLWPSY